MAAALQLDFSERNGDSSSLAQRPVAEPAELAPVATSTPAQELLERIPVGLDLEDVGVALLRVAQTVESGERPVHELTTVVLADPFLAQKLIRAANIVAHVRGAATVTTVSKAIVLLGMDRVRSLSRSATFVEALRDQNQVLRIHQELGRALYATILARELAVGPLGIEPEEAAVCALFRGIGRLTASVYLYPMYERALSTARAQGIDASVAAVGAIGMSFERLTVELLNRWKVPERIVQSALPSPAMSRSASPQLALRTIAEFSVSTAEAVRASDPSARRRSLEALLDRYGPPLSLTRRRLREMLRLVDERTRELGQALGVFGAGTAGNCLDDNDLMTLSPSNRPGASLTLGAGVIALSRMIEREEPPARLLRHALDVLLRAFQFQRVVLCAKDDATRRYAVRAAVGRAPIETGAVFGFQEMASHDLFNAALLQHADVYIRDAADPTVQKSLPEWFKSACADARSFLLLPLGGASGTIGFLYADYGRSNVQRLTHEEVQLVKTLKQQVSIALRRSA
jgi:HD-like signal output (HDOD) protein